METWINLLCNILDWWYLDVKYLVDLYEKNNIEIDIENIRAEYGEININILIHKILREIAETFIENNRDEIEEIIDIIDIISWNDIYNIYTNCIDSHLRFDNEKVQELFEKSEFRV